LILSASIEGDFTGMGTTFKNPPNVTSVEGDLANLCRANSQGHHQVKIRHGRGPARYVLIGQGTRYRSSDRRTGKLTKNLSHLAVNFSHPKKDIINIELHHGARKNVATLRTVRTLINNLIVGVTKGFRYKMRYVYAHFPINVNVDKNSETGLYEVEIRYVVLEFGNPQGNGRSGADGT
jgi:Ribosomal protein L6